MRVVVIALVSLVGCSKSQPTASADPAPSASTAPKIARVVASGQSHPWGVYVDATHVYWSNKGDANVEGAVMRVAKTGGAPERVAGAKTPYAIAVYGRRVLWTSPTPVGGGIAESIPGSGSSGTTTALVHRALHEPWSLVVRGNRIYWTELGERVVMSAPIDDPNATVALPVIDWSKIETHATAKGRPVGLAVDDTHVYWTDSDPGVVAKTPIAGGAVTALVTGGDKTTGIAVDGTHVYWSEWGSGRIAKIPKEGGAIVTLATGEKGARSIAMDATRIYFTHPPSGSVKSVAKTGGAVVTHATGQKHPYSVAVDDTSFYWANVDGDTVMSLTK